MLVLRYINSVTGSELSRTTLSKPEILLNHRLEDSGCPILSIIEQEVVRVSCKSTPIQFSIPFECDTGSGIAIEEKY